MSMDKLSISNNRDQGKMWSFDHHSIKMLQV